MHLAPSVCECVMKLDLGALTPLRLVIWNFSIVCWTNPICFKDGLWSATCCEFFNTVHAEQSTTNAYVAHLHAFITFF